MEDGTTVPDSGETEYLAGVAAPDDVADPSRRRFLIRTISAIGGGITLALGIPSALYATGSIRSGQAEDQWIRLGSASSVDIGGPPALMKAEVSRRTGYLVESQEISAFVITENGTDFTVLSNVCTHLGCRVRWVEEQESFFCPCHNGVFDRNGQVIGGPPPRPLDRFESKVEEGQILFKEA